MLDHVHHAHGEHETGHVPAGGLHDDHEDVFARDVAKDQVRIGPDTMLWIALLGLASWSVATLRPSRLVLSGRRRRRETDPPFAQIWQFVWRCAPLSAAPPAVR